MDARADDIVIQTETPGASTTLFRIAIGKKVIAEHLDVAHASTLTGDILERLAQRAQLRRRSLLSKLNEASPYLLRRRNLS